MVFGSLDELDDASTNAIATTMAERERAPAALAPASAPQGKIGCESTALLEWSEWAASGAWLRPWCATHPQFVVTAVLLLLLLLLLVHK